MNVAATVRQPQALEYATITVQYVNEKQANRHSASIKDTDSVLYWIKPDDTKLYRVGGRYEIGFIVTESNDRINRTIKEMQPVHERQPQPQPARAAAQQGPRPTVVRSAPVQQTPAQPAPQPNGNGQQYNRPTSPRDAERMFVCATLGHFISTGRVDPTADHLIAHITEIRAAWQATFGQDDPTT